MGILSDLNRKRKKAQKKILKTVAKPFRKVGKALPKELRWMAPYLAAVAPYTSFMMPGGIASSALGRTLMSSLYNIGGQAIADPEGEDINLLSAALAGGQGYLTTPGMEGELMGATTRGKEMAAMGDYMGPPDMAQVLQDRNLLTTAKDIGLTGASKLAGLAGGAGDTLGSLTSNPASLFTLEGAKKGLQAITPAVMQGTGDTFKAMADKGYRDWKAIDDEEQAQIQETTTANNQEAADLTMKYYRQAGHDEETIQEHLDLNNLGDFYVPPVTAAQGGIIGLRNGGMLNLGGNEMDYRGGGFVPIGKRERADDVPARLSKNEFVMTADAVKAAGGGSVNKGAQRMYNVMNQLEARA